MQKKVKIHQFDPVIYPRILWVIVTDDPKDISDRFDSECEYEQAFDTSSAFVFKCTEKDSRNLGICVCFTKNKFLSMKNIAHESVHIASCIFEDCNMTMGFSDGKDEHFAYLVGWAADCINKVRTNKFK